MNEYNLCPICGGAKRIDWTISFEQCCPVEMRFEPASLAGNRRLCPGHPEPAPKHDGNLPPGRNGNTYLVKLMFRTHFPEIASVYIGHEETSNDEVWLDPNQALSLLVWLKQEEAELQRLAKEQEG